MILVIITKIELLSGIANKSVQLLKRAYGTFKQ